MHQKIDEIFALDNILMFCQRKQVFLAEIVIQGKKDEKGQYQFEKP